MKKFILYLILSTLTFSSNANSDYDNERLGSSIITISEIEKKSFEFGFSYFCAGCVQTGLFVLDRYKSSPFFDIAYYPVTQNEKDEVLARYLFASKAFGYRDEMHEFILKHMQRERITYNDDEEFSNLLEKIRNLLDDLDVSRNEFDRVFKSFGIDLAIRRSSDRWRTWAFEGHRTTPIIQINNEIIKPQEGETLASFRDRIRDLTRSTIITINNERSKIHYVKVEAREDKIETLLNEHSATLDRNDARKTTPKLIKELTDLANQGNPFSQYALARHYFSNVSNNKAKLDQAFDFLRSAADQGHIGAQFYISQLYFRGELIEKNHTDLYYYTLLNGPLLRFKIAAMREMPGSSYSSSKTYYTPILFGTIRSHSSIYSTLINVNDKVYNDIGAQGRYDYLERGSMLLESKCRTKKSILGGISSGIDSEIQRLCSRLDK